MDILANKVKEEPVVFTFLGLTVAALAGGLRTLVTGDRRNSNLMMRARVFFQLCTVGTLVGTIYWKAYNNETSASQQRALGFCVCLRPFKFFRPAPRAPAPLPRSHGLHAPRGRAAARLPD